MKKSMNELTKKGRNTTRSLNSERKWWKRKKPRPSGNSLKNRIKQIKTQLFPPKMLKNYQWKGRIRKEKSLAYLGGLGTR